MKQPRRWAVLTTALLLAASLVFAPRGGSAGPARGFMLPGDPQTVPEQLNEPDVPPYSVKHIQVEAIRVSLTVRLGSLARLVSFVLQPRVEAVGKPCHQTDVRGSK
jgi:hypothetical protein